MKIYYLRRGSVTLNPIIMLRGNEPEHGSLLNDDQNCQVLLGRQHKADFEILPE